MFFLRGLAIGFAIAAPVGPIGVLCMRRTLAQGRVCGLVSGLGAATADAVYGCIAGFGLTLVANFLVSQQTALRVVGGVFLCFLGVRTFLARPSEKPVSSSARGLLGSYASTFLLTLTNPLTILSFAAAFAGSGLTGTQANFAAAATLVLGVFTGSALWWLLLSTFFGALRGTLSLGRLQWVNRLSGAVITGFGLFALYGAL